jgi:hypothetical protein
MVLTHLSRIYDAPTPRLWTRSTQWLIKMGSSLGFEVKFGRIRHEREIPGRTKKIYILSKDTLGNNAIPVSLFLAMLNIPQTIEF